MKNLLRKFALKSNPVADLFFAHVQGVSAFDILWKKTVDEVSSVKV